MFLCSFFLNVLIRFAGQRWASTLKNVSISRAASLSDIGINDLAKGRLIKELYVPRTAITDAALLTIAEYCPEIETIDISFNDVCIRNLLLILIQLASFFLWT